MGKLNRYLGNATETKQDTANASLSSIDGKVSTSANQTTLNTRVGDLTEPAPGTDTASSGLNGRLQRIAQRLTSIFTALSDGTQQGSIRGNTDGTLIGNQGSRLTTVTKRDLSGTTDIITGTATTTFTLYPTTPGNNIAQFTLVNNSGNRNLRFSFNGGTTFITIPGGGIWSEQELRGTITQISIASDSSTVGFDLLILRE